MKASQVTYLALTASLVFALVAAWRRPQLRTARGSGSSSAQRAQSPIAPSDRLSSIEGAVTDANRAPIVGARVCAVYASVGASNTPGLCSTSEAGGLYLLPGVPAGNYLVTAARAGYVTGSAANGEPIEVLAATTRRKVDISLVAGGATIAGQAVDATGGPIPHATIRAERLEPPRAAVDVEADDSGRFSLWFPVGVVLLVGTATGYAPGRWDGPAPASDVRLVLTPGASVTGTVVSSVDGHPVPGVEVRAGSGRLAPSVPPPRSVSDEQGRFALRGLGPGSYKLTAKGEGWYGESKQDLPLALAGAIDGVRLEVGPAVPVTGRVVLADTGQPCPQGAVKLGPPDRRAPPPSEDPSPADRSGTKSTFSAVLGAEGEVHFPGVLPGRYFVSIRCQDKILREGPRVLEVGTSTIDKLMWKVGAGPRLRVLCVDEEGVPIPGALVDLRLPRWSDAGPGTVLYARTDNAGRYEYTDGLYPGTYELRASAPFEAEPVRVDLAETDAPVHEATLRIAGSASLVATVRERTGATVDGLTVTAVAQTARAPETAATATSDGPSTDAHAQGRVIAESLGGGRYRFAPLRPGPYEVRVDDGVNPTVRTPYALAAKQAGETSIQIERSTQLRGQVLDADGIAVPDAWVSAIADGDLSGCPRFVHGTPVLTNAEGRFVIDRLSRLAPSYTVRAERAKGSKATKSGVRPSDGDVVVRFVATARVTGTVDGACQGTEGIRVEATNVETQEATSQVVAGSGSAFDLEVAPGPVQVLAICLGGGGTALAETRAAPLEVVGGLRLLLQRPGAAQQAQ
ncbi:MAG: carboxypeptidase regulatory-like domain-containing protein [Polyangiaceae bacterium]